MPTSNLHLSAAERCQPRQEDTDALNLIEARGAMFPKQKQVTRITSENQAIEELIRRRQGANLAANIFARMSESAQRADYERDELNAILCGDFDQYREPNSQVRNPDAPFPKRSIETLLKHGDSATYVELY